ncbi:MAG: cytochrome c [Bryobacteraceae bacterium]
MRFALLQLSLLMDFPNAAHAAPTSVTFSKDVAPIFYEHCVSCHRAGDIAPKSLLTYSEARPWAAAIREAVASRTMPPWHANPHYGRFANDARLSDKQIDTIQAWARQGAKEGNPADLPPAPKFEKGWRIGKPDAVFTVPEFTLSSQGYDEQKTFFVDTGLTEDMWAEAVEIRPGNRIIVHHAHVWIEERPACRQLREHPPNLVSNIRCGKALAPMRSPMHR